MFYENERYSMIGIYKLNFKDGSFYIGQSININRRLYYHSHTKGRGSPKLQKAYTESEYVNHEILEECDLLGLSTREEYWINKLKPTLNTLPGGPTLAGLNHSRSKYTKEQILKVIHLYVDTYKSISDIAREADVSISTAHDICKGRAHTWATAEIDLESVRADRENSKSFYVYYKDGSKHLVESHTEFEIKHNLTSGSMTRIFLNKSCSINKGEWSLFPIDFTKYKLTTDEGIEFIGTLDYIKEVFNDLELSNNTKARLLRGKPSLGFTMKKLPETAN